MSPSSIDETAAKVHAEFIREKTAQGYHIPPECPVWLESPLRELWPEREKNLHCGKCLNALYPLYEKEDSK